jgi:uncharacterized protein with NRDE domain
VYGLSNHLLDTDWPKVTATKSALRALLEEKATELIPALFVLLGDRRQAADHLLPATGVSPDWERLLSAAFIVSADYGTRSATVLLVGRDGRVVFVERTFVAGGVAAGEARHDFG